MNQQQGTIFSKVAMPIAITAIVVYLICSAWVGMRDPYKFTVAYTDSMETSVNATGWVVRSEVPVSGASGVVQLLRGQGEKVAKGKDLAVVYQDETYVASQEELLQVQTDLTALQYATYPESPSGTALEEQMLSSMTSLRQAASSGNFSGLEDQSATYRKLVLRREYLLSSNATTAMTGSQPHPGTGVTKREGLGPRDLEAFAQTDPTPADNVIGKLVTNAAWYYAITVPGDTVGRFDNGDSVDVFFDSLSESFPMTVYSVGEVQDNKVVVVLRSSQDDDKAEDLRQESGRVIFHSSEGIRVPKQALRITKDGERGVYVVVSQKARFRPVTILAEDDTSYLVKAAPTSEEDTRILRDGDQVVLASAELTDGKVVR